MGTRASLTRKSWLLLGGFVAFLLVFGLLERFVGTAPSSSETTKEAVAPEVPTVRRLDDGAIEIRHDLFRRSTIRLGDEEDEKALLDCISQGIEESFGDGQAEGWSGRQVRSETQRIRDHCMRSLLEVPVLPPSPPAGEN